MTGSGQAADELLWQLRQATQGSKKWAIIMTLSGSASLPPHRLCLRQRTKGLDALLQLNTAGTVGFFVFFCFSAT